MAERELLSSLIDSENEFDAVQRRLLELSELFPLTFWKHLDRLNVQEQRTPRWSFLINTNGIQESVTELNFFPKITDYVKSGRSAYRLQGSKRTLPKPTCGSFILVNIPGTRGRIL